VLLYLKNENLKKEKKKLEGPYIKGNWKTLNITSFVSANILSSNNTGKYLYLYY